MPRRIVSLAVLLVGLAVFALAPGAPAGTRASIPLRACKPGKPLLCGTVTVPLDYSGQVAGTIDLAVAMLPAKGTPRGTMFMIAGGPGQGSLEAYGLAQADEASFFQKSFPGYNLVTFDDRGTGQSAPLSCPEPGAKLATADIADTAVLAGQCGEEIGPQRVFFSTHDHAEDVERVRQALGLGKIALYGVSYGTKESMAYAYAYPQNLERILLDSVVIPEQTDLFSLRTLQQVPTSFARLCAKDPCAGMGVNTGKVIADLANKLQKKPVVVRVEDPFKQGRLSTMTLDGYRMLNVIIDADLLPPVAAALPAAIQAASRGWYAPLLRLYLLDADSDAIGQFNVGLFITTTCDDGFFPWTPTTPLNQRQALYDQAVAALPPGSTGLFDKWGAAFGSALFCMDWPIPSGGKAIENNPLPDIPVMVLSGDRDMRTPTSEAVAVAARFPQAHLTVVPGVGHSVLGSDLGGCAEAAVIGWLQGGIPPDICPKSPELLNVARKLPKSVAEAPATGNQKGLIGRAVGAVLATLDQASADYLFEQFSVQPTDKPAPKFVSGIMGGSLVSEGQPGVFNTSFRMIGYSDVPGLSLTGGLSIFPGGLPVQYQGTFKVATKGVKGTLTLKGSALTGKLNGKRIVASTGHKGLFGPAVNGLRLPVAP